MKQNIPIFIAGTDGSGKTTLTHRLHEQLASEGISTRIVWSRYNNFFSKPLLAITRLTGHNYYEKHEGHLFGYHEFENLPGFKWLYILLQCIDVNIATYKNIFRKMSKRQLLICERGPWDTLADVVLDTGNKDLPETFIGDLFIKKAKKNSQVFFISRSMENICTSRPELAYDKSMKRKIEIYQHLSDLFNWTVIDNNEDLDQAQKKIFEKLIKLKILS
jgi:Cdc6-like AAA superfamily ATPase